MKPLTLDKALRLHEILGAHIPEFDGDDALEFIGKIISNIRQSEHPEKYVDALMIMSGKTLNELRSFSSDKRLELFTESLIENKVIQLKFFCNKVGFSDG